MHALYVMRARHACMLCSPRVLMLIGVCPLHTPACPQDHRSPASGGASGHEALPQPHWRRGFKAGGREGEPKVATVLHLVHFNEVMR